MKIRKICILMILSLGLVPAAALADVRNFTMAAVDIGGTKFWLPSTLIVKKGDRVKIRIVSKVPGANSVHGFAIDDFKVQELADPKGREIEFVADKVGVFQMRCHLHPAHIGGQLDVRE